MAIGMLWGERRWEEYAEVRHLESVRPDLKDVINLAQEHLISVVISLLRILCIIK